jgi:hypothetical protein
VFGHVIDETSPAQELKSAWRNKENQDRKFNIGKDPAEWNELDARIKGKQK